MMSQLRLNKQQQEEVRHSISRSHSEQFRKQRRRLTINDFDLMQIIGRGSFGEVRLCKDKRSGTSRVS